MAKKYTMRYFEPAECSLAGWVNRSFHVGNGYFGASVFGDTANERISLSEQTLQVVGGKYVNERYAIGNECFSFLHIDTKHIFVKCDNYVRTMDLNDGVAVVEYDFEGVHYTRKHFASYVDKVMVIRLSASKSGALDFGIRPRIAYERDYLIFPEDGRGKNATITKLDENTLELNGILHSYDMEMNMFTHVRASGGRVKVTQANENMGFEVIGADSAEILISLGTNYDMNKVIFALPESVAQCLGDKTSFVSNTERLRHCPSKRDLYLQNLRQAAEFSFDELLARHRADFETKFNRVQVDFGGIDDGSSTNKLLLKYKNDIYSAYLEELHFQMGRYMLLSSSRDGGMPANLQGIWNMYNFAPWTCGFWYNINIQMNYWPAFTCNLRECFSAYHNFNKARFDACSLLADKYIKQLHPEHYTDEKGLNGWIVGTGNNAMNIGDVGGHSGPGTGGLTTKAYWEWYEFTMDRDLLENEAYPFLEAVARFYTKCVDEIDGKMLVRHSSSPEQKIDGKPYVTIGCAFDQQMLFESISDYIKASEIIGIDTQKVDKELYNIAKKQLMLYDPVQVGLSGQIKEYREENYYGEFGEVDHRHISQLVGAFPGTILSAKNPAWKDAAKNTILLRGLNSGKGWSKAHKMLVLARNGGTQEALTMAESVLRENVFDNLWNDHCGVAVFQADANFGMTAAYAEVLLQSHAGYIDVLPQIPKKWKNGSFDGLCARGGFVIGASWENEIVSQIRVHADKGGMCVLRCLDMSSASVTRNDGKVVECAADENGRCCFMAEENCDYIIEGMKTIETCAPITDLSVEHCGSLVKLFWLCADDDAVFSVYKAEDSAADYTLLQSGITDKSFIDSMCAQRATYKVTAISKNRHENDGAVVFVG